MTGSEMLQAIRLGLDKSSGLTLPAFTDTELYDWINKSVRKFVKTRYSGFNIKRESFEQTQKRTEDLRSLVKEDILTVTEGTIKPNSYIADLYQYGDWDESITSGSLVIGRIYKVMVGSIRNPSGAEGITYVEGDYFVATAATWDATAVPTGGYPVNGELYWIALGEEGLIAYIPLGDLQTVVASGSIVEDSVYKVITGPVTYDAIVYAVGEYFVATDTTTYTGGTVIEVTTIRVPVVDCSIDTYSKYLEDPYSEHILHYDRAKPLRLFYQDYVELITDGTYGVIYYYLRYMKRPQEVSSVNDCDLPEHTHEEIVELTVSTLLENIEQPRYQSHAVEASTIE
jgi:hypothetical protein